MGFYCPIPDEMIRKITFLFSPLQLQLRQARFDFRVEWMKNEKSHGKKKDNQSCDYNYSLASDKSGVYTN